MSSHLEEKFAHNSEKPLDFLESIIGDGLIPKNALPSYLLQFIRENTSERQRDVAIVTASKGGFIDIENYTDLDEEDKRQIIKKRGGLVSSIINKRPEFFNMLHLIVPVKNRSGFARLYYKHYLGKKALKNMNT